MTGGGDRVWMAAAWSGRNLSLSWAGDCPVRLSHIVRDALSGAGWWRTDGNGIQGRCGGLEKQIAGNPGRGADEVLVRSAVRLVSLVLHTVPCQRVCPSSTQPKSAISCSCIINYIDFPTSRSRWILYEFFMNSLWAFYCNC